MKTIDKVLIAFYITLFTTVIVYLACEFSFANGVMTERKDSECITPLAVDSIQKSIKIAEVLYTNVAKTYTDDIEEITNLKEHWEQSYFWMKTQYDACEEVYTYNEPQSPDDI